MRVIIGCEDTVFDERSDTDRSKRLTKTHVIVALVGSKAQKVSCVPQGDLRADPSFVRPLRATVEIKDCAFCRIHEECRLDRPHRAASTAKIVGQCLLPVEIGGIDGTVPVLRQQHRLAAEYLPPDAHRRSLVRLAQGRRRGKLRSPKTEKAPNTCHRPCLDARKLLIDGFCSE